MRNLYTLAATAAAVAMLGMAPAQAAPPVLSTGFDNVGALGGWSFVNQSSPAGSGWFQGNPGIFTAHAGADDAYIAANFLSVAGGSGSIDNWMITPQLALPGAATISFYTRSAGTPGFSDQLEVRYSTGGSAVGDFSNVLATIGGGYPSGWQQYTINADLGPTARIAFRYLGSGASADYIGVDTLTVAAVPEPSEWLMLAAGLALLAWHGRRPARRARAVPGSAAAPAPARPAPAPRPHAAAGAALAAALAAAVPRPMLRVLACLPLAFAAQGAMAGAQEGMVMVRDAETGALRPATQAEFAALRAQQVRTPVVPPQVAHRPDGTRQSRVSTRAVYAVATRGADGKLAGTCVHGAGAAGEAMQRGAAQDTAQPSEEHRHEHR